MTYTVRVTKRAREQIKAAATYYEDKQEGLGHEFLDAFRETADWIAQNPRVYAVKFDEIRSVRIKHFKKRRRKRTFRYIALYEVVDNQVPIYAVIGVDTEDSEHKRWRKFRD